MPLDETCKLSDVELMDGPISSFISLTQDVTVLTQQHTELKLLQLREDKKADLRTYK